MLTPARSCALLVMLLASACSGSTTAPSPPATLSTFSLSGQVTINGTASAIPGALLTIADNVNAGKSATTDASGNYSFPALQASGFTLSIQAAGFATSTRGVTLTSNQTVSVSLSRSTVSVRGTVTNGTLGYGLPGVNVDGGGQSTLTDAEGRYVLSNLPPGRLSISASTSGYETVARIVTASSDVTVDIPLLPIVTVCTFALTSPPVETLNQAGGSGVVTMSRTAGSCSWSANTDVCDDAALCRPDLSWLTLLDIRGSSDVRIPYTFTAREAPVPARGAIIQVRWPGGSQDILLEQ